jgi:hypothetical protein
MLSPMRVALRMRCLHTIAFSCQQDLDAAVAKLPPTLVMQLLEAARGAAERRSASLRLTAPPQGWAPPRLPGALVEYVPLDLRGAGATCLSVHDCHHTISKNVKVWCCRSTLERKGPGFTMV